MPVLVAILAGILLGLAGGGQLSRVGDVRIAHPWAVISLFALQGFARGRYLDQGLGDWGLVVWGLSSLCFAGLLLAGRNPGLRIIGAGTLLNLLVVFANGHMPVAAAELNTGTLGSTQLAFYAPVFGATHLAWLGDVLPVTLFGGTTLLSAGDVLLMVGVTVTLVEAMVTPLHTVSNESNGLPAGRSA